MYFVINLYILLIIMQNYTIFVITLQGSVHTHEVNLVIFMPHCFITNTIC